ncbi:aldo/keto reductase [Lentilactobacillus farraginis]|uniref:2,5-didehydrogluconate reductase n=1 Tax=Lentilactobacillus farraginis DSM 18382 = JCM 14108 TaxID=1423743 RepID=X0PIQ9_9LACO|nr:aldo/keto reductase [Lentilactobacillus farraginis]KRM01102.1 2,5-didehydrogluconate reductase [Lentilactobacillus farraginis DSM 18382 = JCM 14108]GAF37027.1 oxidoreductase [Lentilactobacillus farraginis DSM 18382 = JCM 14108]
MTKQNIGSKVKLADGNEMPVQGLGVYRMTDENQVINSVKSAYHDGYRLFDTAQMYKNEAAVGKAVKDLNVNRDDLFITTKIAEENQGYDKVMSSFEESLKKLQLDYVDMLLVHWPIHTHFFETWRAFESLKEQGLVKSIGTSNYGMLHLQYLATKANEMPVVNQLEVHPYLSQQAMVDFDRENHIVTQAWAPLGRGRIFDDPVIVKIAEAHDKSAAQVILRWHLQRGDTFIPKSVHPQRIQQNADIYDFELSDDEMEQIAGLNRNTRISQEPEMVYEIGHQYPHH